MRLIPIAFMISAFGLSACAITSSSNTGPHGRPVHYIDGMSAAIAFNKAGALCANGYDILGEPKQTSAFDYEMTVECH